MKKKKKNNLKKIFEIKTESTNGQMLILDSTMRIIFDKDGTFIPNGSPKSLV